MPRLPHAHTAPLQSRPDPDTGYAHPRAERPICHDYPTPACLKEIGPPTGRDVAALAAGGLRPTLRETSPLTQSSQQPPHYRAPGAVGIVNAAVRILDVSSTATASDRDGQNRGGGMPSAYATSGYPLSAR